MKLPGNRIHCYAVVCLEELTTAGLASGLSESATKLHFTMILEVLNAL